MSIMNQRLAWNFSINSESPLDFRQLPEEEPDTLRWEARYFWPHDSDITLFGLTSDYLDLSAFTAKRREDIYYLLPDALYNIKQRRGDIVYKPLLNQSDNCLAFGKKINLHEQPVDLDLPGISSGNVGELLKKIQQQSRQVPVVKSALIYKFATLPTIKLELARLCIGEQIYFSACIEGRSQNLVNLISKHLIKQPDSCDYVTFLKQNSQP